MTDAPLGKRPDARVLALLALCGLLAGCDTTPVRDGQSVVTVMTVPTPGQYGWASWHDPSGSECHTASEHLWVGTELVAAHRTLPLGSKVRVTNLVNGHETVVKITDRGPYCHGRIIDVSRSAALQLGLIQSGTARVRVEALPDSGAPGPSADSVTGLQPARVLATSVGHP